MNFQVTFQNKDFSYNLGFSRCAVNACEALVQYNKSHQYKDLRIIFANLHWIVEEDSDYKRKACLSSQIFALSVFPTLNSKYEKFFVANSVISIYTNAGINEPKDWKLAHVKYGQELQNGEFNLEKATNAGIAILKMEDNNDEDSPKPL